MSSAFFLGLVPIHKQLVRICYAHRFGGQRVSTWSFCELTIPVTLSVSQCIERALLSCPPLCGHGECVCRVHMHMCVGMYKDI